MKIHYRRFASRDRMPAYRLFRETVWDYMQRRGMAEAEDKNEIEQYFEQQRDLYLHLEQSAAEDWVAENDQRQLLGWARSIERDEHLQLTHFFVDPAAQGGGVGHGLLERAFAPGRARRRSIIATESPLALSLYLRYGVNVLGMAFAVNGRPQHRPWRSDLQVERLPQTAASLERIIAIDSAVLGYRRGVDLQFFLRTQPAFLFSRDGAAAGYAFGCDHNLAGPAAGPAAALDARDLPDLIQQVEASAVDIGVESLWLTIPAGAQRALRWALQSGYRIDPFHEILLGSDDSLKLDRYLMTQSSFIW